jgi:hypothetical protein
MTTLSATHHPADEPKRFVRRHSTFFERMARFGYAMKGTVYVLLGAITLSAALRPDQSAPDKKSALRTVLEQPFGQTILGIITLGLLAYALWRLIQGILDTENDGRSWKAIGKRLARVGSGVIYGVLGFAAARTLLGVESANSGDGQVQDWTAWGMSKPFGRLAIAVVGLSVVGRGIQQLWHAWKAKLGEELAVGKMNPAGRRAALFTGRFGLAARGVTFVLIGGFLALAAWNANPNEAKGLGGALRYVEAARYGDLLLGVVAIGLIAYGIFAMVEARYRVMNTNPR